MNNCTGCGVLLQTKDKNEIGYTTNIEKKLCERCFRIKNYGEYKVISKDNNEFIKILEEINKTKDLCVLVIDLFNLNTNMEIFYKNLKNDILLVLTKRDLIPKSVHDEKLINYFKNTKLNIIDTTIISSYKNYNLDELYEKINKYKKGKNVYVIGFTNAGKSTMINKIIYNYTNEQSEITTSILPSTTLNKINVRINDELNIIDTPGILIENSYYDILNGKQLKKIIPKKEIKPITYQVKEHQYIILDEYGVLELENMNITLFMSNALNIKRIYKKPINNLEKTEIDVDNCDIVIHGLGFIKCNGKGKVKVYTYKNISVTTRKHLI